MSFSKKLIAFCKKTINCGMWQRVICFFVIRRLFMLFDYGGFAVR